VSLSIAKTLQARANDVLMMSNRALLRFYPACALPFRQAGRWHLCQAKIRKNAPCTEGAPNTACVLDRRTTVVWNKTRYSAQHELQLEMKYI